MESTIWSFRNPGSIRWMERHWKRVKKPVVDTFHKLEQLRKHIDTAEKERAERRNHRVKIKEDIAGVRRFLEQLPDWNIEKGTEAGLTVLKWPTEADREPLFAEHFDTFAKILSRSLIFNGLDERNNRYLAYQEFSIIGMVGIAVMICRRENEKLFRHLIQDSFPWNSATRINIFKFFFENMRELYCDFYIEAAGHTTFLMLAAFVSEAVCYARPQIGDSEDCSQMAVLVLSSMFSSQEFENHSSMNKFILYAKSIVED